MRAIWLTERRSREVFESGCKEKQDGFNRKILNTKRRSHNLRRARVWAAGALTASSVIRR